MIVTASLLLTACGGGGGGSTPPVMTPTTTPAKAPTPSPAPSATANPQAFVCPTTGANSVARFGFGSSEALSRHMPLRISARPLASATTLLAVSYDRATAASNLRLIQGRESALGTNLVHTYDYPQLNVAMRVVSVPTVNLQQIESSLRAQAGVRSIGITGERRYHTTTAAVYTNDPYFQGFIPSNFETPPYSEGVSVPGQWDMHAIGLEHAYGYSTATGGSGTYSPTMNAFGLASVKIAIIDTGADASHPELASKIGYQHCFITNQTETAQSTGIFATDEVGHGTDVAGIAAAASKNGLGFTGAGGLSTIYAYRVFPTPDDNCVNESTNDPQCSSDTADIVSAINDAITQHVNVISMSLGGGSCTNGADSDLAEGTAVANAIAAGIIVVAAAGNSATPGSTPGVTAPGCDTGVIAVGATSLDDGTPTGTSSYTTSLASAASASNIVEYVASYSQYDTTNTLHSSSSWGIVAPGGDPSNADTNGNSNTTDDLHWIENIWTSTPFIGYAGDTNFTGNCNNDYPSTLSNNPDCRTLIAGTSMSTPHVAGAAALILAVSGSTYASPAAMKQLLCQTADDLQDGHQGCGRLNVYRAVAKAIGDTSPP